MEPLMVLRRKEVVGWAITIVLIQSDLFGTEAQSTRHDDSKISPHMGIVSSPSNRLSNDAAGYWGCDEDRGLRGFTNALLPPACLGRTYL
ncbi:hypothetical protein EYF80_030210 [Liparis tanakae]|uniref:Uncharacterized protein n=1 Tax=Liparis tanakae TaxID=230148 RepID=A0A4Z2H271_9TELE|nr:hypothetical protein EYF80_030210 [Liparis tanakae]